jgi:DNA-binding IclR family transcriptional regulator
MKLRLASVTLSSVPLARNPNPTQLQSISRELLAVLADVGEPMSVRDLVDHGGLDPHQATLQLSVARVAGFVRAAPGTSSSEPLYAPTSLGFALARRSSAFARAQEQRRAA